MGRALLGQERPADAIPYFKEASGIFSRMNDLYNEIHSHRGLYESYWEINPDSAKHELECFNQLKDSLYSHATAESLSRYNAEFGNDLLQKENHQMRRDHQRTLIIGVFIVLLILIASWLSIRHMRRRYQLRMQKLMAEIEQLSNQDDKTPAPTPTPQAAATAPPAPEAVTDAEDRQFLKSVIEAVNAAMANGRISVEQIASDLYMGEQSFRQRLQSAAGESPKDFFSAIQMERASSLLTERLDILFLK